MTPEQEQFAIDLTDNSRTHDDFLLLVRFGMKTLLEHQTVLIEIIFREAERELKRKNLAGRTISDEGRKIFDELGLRFTQTDS